MACAETTERLAMGLKLAPGVGDLFPGAARSHIFLNARNESIFGAVVSSRPTYDPVAAGKEFPNLRQPFLRHTLSCFHPAI